MTTRAAPQVPRAGAPVPPLEAGDHLTRDEFERRYDATPGLKKAELIEGIVYMPPPAVRWDHHGGPHADLMGWLGYYRSLTPGVRAGDNTSIRLDMENEPQPDAVLFIEPGRGGGVRLSEGYVQGAPELVAEVSASTVSIDLNTKFRVYRRNGVREYLVWRVLERAIDWFALRGGQYVRLVGAEDGTLRSEVFPGLWLAPDAMLDADLAAVLETVQKGAATGEHAEFVARVRAAQIL